MRGPLAILLAATDPIPSRLAIPGLLVVSALAVALACVLARTMEINYSTE